MEATWVGESVWIGAKKPVLAVFPGEKVKVVAFSGGKVCIETANGKLVGWTDRKNLSLERCAFLSTLRLP